MALKSFSGAESLVSIEWQAQIIVLIESNSTPFRSAEGEDSVIQGAMKYMMQRQI